MNRISSSFPVGRPGGALTSMSELRSHSRHLPGESPGSDSVLALPGAVGRVPFLVALLDPVLPVLGLLGRVERADAPVHAARLVGSLHAVVAAAPVVLRGFGHQRGSSGFGGSRSTAYSSSSCASG